MAKTHPEIYGIRGKFFNKKDLDNVKRIVNPDLFSHKEDGLSTYAMVVKSMECVESPFVIFKPQGVDHFFGRKKTPTDKTAFAQNPETFERWQEDPVTKGQIEV